MLTDYTEITQWLDTYNIQDYLIHDNHSVSVNGSVDLSDVDINTIDVQFYVIGGDFDCSKNILKSLLGCPQEVHGDFNCSKNNLTSLEHGPIIVTKQYDCSYNNLTSLIGRPDNIDDSFSCDNNLLTSLNSLPQYIKRQLFCYNNPINDLKDFTCEYGGNLQHCYIDNNNPSLGSKPIADFEDLYKLYRTSYYLTISHKDLNSVLSYHRLQENIPSNINVNNKTKVKI